MEVGDAVLVKDSYCKHCHDLLGKVGFVNEIRIDAIQVLVSPDFQNGWGRQFLVWCPVNGVEKA